MVVDTNANLKKGFIDLVVAGPDFSGTTTQIGDLVDYFKSKGLRVKDLRGTETDALFHSEPFSDLSGKYTSLREFMDDSTVSQNIKNYVLEESYNFLSGRNKKSDLRVASMVRNESTEYINPNNADVWILEEPTRRGAGQNNRVIEQNLKSYMAQGLEAFIPESYIDPLSAALSHQAYRKDEFLRFRRALRENGKIILRSRSEESACYQVFDEKYCPKGLSMKEFSDLPGHKIAFANAPTDIFVVCGPQDWDKKDYIELKSQRTGNRLLDGYENDIGYQLLVNKRYSSSWLEVLYQVGSNEYTAKPQPEIHRFDIYHNKEEIKQEMISKVEKILTKRH
jgi:hypothetical protein